MRALAVIAALVVSWGTEARAACAPSFPFVLPLAGETVPENPVLYVFAPNDSESDHASDEQTREFLSSLWVESTTGTALPFELTLVLSNSRHDVFTLRVAAKAGTSFFVRPFHKKPLTVSSKVKFDDALSLTRRLDINHRWMCSHQSMRRVAPSIDAPAFRVTWNNKTTVLPGRDASFFWFSGVKPDLELTLGKTDCRWDVMSWSKPTEFTVTALLSDGREVTAAPLTLEPPPPYESLPTR